MAGGKSDRAHLRLHAAARALAVSAGVLLMGAAGPAVGGETNPLAAAPPSAVATDDLLMLQCTVVDAATGDTISARCRINDHSGSNRIPYLGSLYHSANGGYFYTNGTFWLDVPRGLTVVRAAQGFEYDEFADTLDVEADTSIVIPLARIVRMSDFGWYSGDTHAHASHSGGYYTITPEKMLFMARAEGLNVVNCLDNGYAFTGAPASCSTRDCIIFPSEEYRSGCYGHLGLLGMRSLLTPVWTMWWPMLADVADTVHARGRALVVSAHPISSFDFAQVESWPGSGIARELPVDVVANKIDAIDVMSYSNCRPGGIETDLWYRLLNCGFRIPASAGTDAAMNRYDSFPLGGYRTFVLIPQGPFTFDSWLANLAKGRTFVSNGPLITHFDVDGFVPGDSLTLSSENGLATGRISVRSLRPFDRIEIVRSGVVVETIETREPLARSVDTTFTVPLVASCWVAARVIGSAPGWSTVGGDLFAHTSPVYFTLRGERVAKEEDAEYFVAWIDSLQALGAAKGQWPDTLSAAKFFASCRAAREFYATLTESYPADAGGNRPPLALRCENAPNPFSGSTSVTFGVPGRSAGIGGATSAASGAVRLAVYDVQGRLVRMLVESSLGTGTYTVSWDGKDGRGRRLASGVYFARISAAGRTLSRKMLLVR